MGKLYQASLSTSTTILVLALVAILPFLLLNLYNHPAMDDYVFASRDTGSGFFATQLELYLNWSGRYFGTASSRLNPVIDQDFTLYKVYSFMVFVIFISATIFFFHSLLRHVFNLKHIVSLSLLVFTVILVQLPDIAQGLYWFAGYITYLGAIIYTLTLFGILLRLSHCKSKITKALLQTTGLILAFAIVGSNELSMVILNASLLLLLLTQWQLYKKLSPYFVCLFLVAFVLALVVVLAPGNYARMDGQAKSGNLLFSLAGAGLMTLLSFVKWGFVLLLMSLIYLLTWAIPIYSYTKGKAVFKASLPLSFAWFLLTLFAMHFLFIYSTGFRAGSRVENVIYFFFVFGWLYLLQVSISKYGHRLLQSVPARPSVFASVLTVMFIIRVFSLDSNITTAYLDVISGKAAIFNRELNARYAYLQSSNCSSCPITPVTVLPKSLYIFSALRSDEVAEMGINKDFTAYWGKTKTYLTGPTPAIKDNLTTLKDIGKQIQKQLFNMEN